MAVPADAAQDRVDRLWAEEAERIRQLAQDDHLIRLWQLQPSAAHPGIISALSLCRAADAAEIQETLRALPLRPWLTVEVTPLTRHPSDPGLNVA